MCAHAGRETSPHKKTWSAHKCSLRKYFALISYTSFQIQMSSAKMLHKRNYMCTQTLKELEGTLLVIATNLP